MLTRCAPPHSTATVPGPEASDRSQLMLLRMCSRALWPSASFCQSKVLPKHAARVHDRCQLQTFGGACAGACAERRSL